MNDLEKYFPNQINLLKDVGDKFKKSQNEIRELNEIVLQLKNTNIVLQQSEAKLNDKIHNYNNQIYNDTKIINDYYKMKNENGIFRTENESLKNRVYNLEQKIKQIEIENKRNIENVKNNFKTNEKTLEEQIQTLQASYTLDNFEKENDIKRIKYEYERKLENAVKREQSLKIELFDLKHHMTTSVSVLNKKISELQEKNKRLQSNMATKNTNFMSAKNILNISTSNLLSNNTSASSCDFPGNLTNNKTSTNNTQIQNTVNINNIEINPVKKFKFRKPHGSAKKLLSEDFDPFKMHKETSTSYNIQNKSSSHIDHDNTCNIVDNSFIEVEDNQEDNICKNHQKFDNFTEDIESYIIQPETSYKKDKNHSNFAPKKRKLFNPNNFDYLE